MCWFKSLLSQSIYTSNPIPSFHNTIKSEQRRHWLLYSWTTNLHSLFFKIQGVPPLFVETLNIKVPYGNSNHYWHFICDVWEKKTGRRNHDRGNLNNRLKLQSIGNDAMQSRNLMASLMRFMEDILMCSRQKLIRILRWGLRILRIGLKNSMRPHIQEELRYPSRLMLGSGPFTWSCCACSTDRQYIILHLLSSFLYVYVQFFMHSFFCTWQWAQNYIESGCTKGSNLWWG